MFLHSCPFCWGNFAFLFPIEYSTYMSLLKSTYVFPARPPVFNQVLSWEPHPQAATVFQVRWDCTLRPGEVKNTIIKWQSTFELWISNVVSKFKSQSVLAWVSSWWITSSEMRAAMMKCPMPKKEMPIARIRAYHVDCPQGTRQWSLPDRRMSLVHGSYFWNSWMFRRKTKGTAKLVLSFLELPEKGFWQIKRNLAIRFIWNPFCESSWKLVLSLVELPSSSQRLHQWQHQWQHPQ